MENNIVEQNKKKNVIIGLMACVIILLIAALVYFLFIKKDKTEEGNKEQVVTNNISVKKSLEVFAFKILLDTNGNAYLDLREENIDAENYKEVTNLFNTAQTYNFDGKSEKLVKIDLQNVKDIQVFDFGNGGGKYIVFLDNNNKAYALIDYKVEGSGNIQLLTDDKLNNVSEIQSDCDGDGSGGGGCSVFAITEVNDKVEYVQFYDLFEKDE